MDEKTEFTSNLPKGKLSKKTLERIDLKGQSGITCVLYSMKRLANFQDGRLLKESLEYKAYKIIKKALAEYEHNNDSNFTNLATAMEEACDILGMDVKNIIRTSLYNRNPEFPEELLTICTKAICSSSNSKQKSEILYGAMQERIFTVFGVAASTWKPQKEDFQLFKEKLQNDGAMMFIGRYGKVFHTNYGRRPDDDTDSREVYAFPKGSYVGDTEKIGWTHAIIVDQVKEVNDVNMVIFRDPFDESKIDKKEKVYMMRYETFCERMSEFNKIESVKYSV